jgi:hypothetical protein
MERIAFYVRSLFVAAVFTAVGVWAIRRWPARLWIWAAIVLLPPAFWAIVHTDWSGERRQLTLQQVVDDMINALGVWFLSVALFTILAMLLTAGWAIPFFFGATE